MKIIKQNQYSQKDEILEEILNKYMLTQEATKGNFEKNEIETDEICKYIGEEIVLHGSIYKIRKMSQFAFVLLRCKREIIQCVYSEEFSCFPLQELIEESCVLIKAKVVKEERSKSGVELHLFEVKVLSTPKEECPVVIHNKGLDASLETTLNYRPITLRNEKERAIFKLQEGIVRGFREFLYHEKFTEIHTPKIVAAGAEGGANIFMIPYFGKEAYLAQSPQVYKQMMVGVYERVFEVGPVFRAEKHDTSI